ncbi:MAG: tail fiber domain-containing protein [Candidatus Moranbacteria bacterium]|nr:tail fiber domain-containing protein [Candidatus Moranbacteria bacterium]
MRLRKIYISIAMIAAGLAVQAVLASPVSAALYAPQGVTTSTNLLSGSSASGIDSFHYNIATLPATSSVRIQFSKDNTNWYSSGGTPSGWDTLALGQADLSLTAFVTASSWVGGNAFYYKLETNSTSDLSDTPTIDDIRLDYTPTSGYENVFVFSNFGNVGIGTTNPAYALDVGGGTAGMNIRGYDVYTHDGAVTSFSDQRLKSVQGNFDRGLNEILALNPTYYHYKSDNSLGLASSETEVGLMAQDVQKLIPEAVQMTPSGYLSMSQGPIFYAMINAVKEQQGMIIQEQAKNTQQETAIADVNLKTSQNVETVGQLQKSVDDNLSVISSNFSAVDTKLALHDSAMASVNNQLTTLDTKVAGIDVQLADLAAKYTTLDTGMSLSEAEKTDLETRLTAAENSLVENQHDLITFEKGTNDTLSSMLDTEDMLTSRVLDHEDRIKVLEEKLATTTITAGGEIPTNVVTQDAFGNVTLAGIFKAKQVEANGVVAGSVTVKNEKEGVAPTMGDGEIKSVPVDADGDGIDDVTKKPVVPSDGKTAEINTKAVSETAKVFVTFENDPGSRYWVEKVQDGATKEYTGFTLKLSEIAKSGAKFSWWIVEYKN